MFTTHPPTRQCFTQFSNLALDGELQECQEFREMAEKVRRRILRIVMLMTILQVMERLDNALFSIEDPETMKSILMETGAYHRRVEGFRLDMFKVRK